MLLRHTVFLDLRITPIFVYGKSFSIQRALRFGNLIRACHSVLGAFHFDTNRHEYRSVFVSY